MSFRKHKSRHTARAGSRDRGSLPVVAAIVIALTGCATPGMRQIESDLDDIQQQLWKIQKENATLTEQVKEISGSDLAAEVTSGPAAGELQIRLHAAERDLEMLRSRAADNEQRLSAVVQDLRATREALQSLIASFPDVDTTGSEPSGFGAVADDAMPAPVPVPVPQGGVPALPNDDLYRQGRADYTKGNYSLALQELIEFVDRFPESALADDAQYLIGEVHFSQQQYPEAIEAFDRVIDDYGDSNVAGSAHYKKGLSLLARNRTADAVVQFQYVINNYPRSDEARNARERLESLGLQPR